ncbi:hypothetical protein MPER_07176, partial [Moniliophthora perniciosa FA553]
MEAIDGPFSIITSTFESEALLQVIFYSIYNVLVLTASSGTAPPSGEAILDQVLHLVMLAIVERAHIFCTLAPVRSFEEEKNLIDVLCTLEYNDNFKPYKARVSWILNEMEKHAPLEVQSRRFIPSTSDAPDPEELRKKAAKARQEAIMKQMKAQQDSFALNFDDVDDQEDEDMEDAEQQEVTYGTCIVCQENLTSARSFGTLGSIAHLNHVLQAPTSMDRLVPSPLSITFPPKDADALDAK